MRRIVEKTKKFGMTEELKQTRDVFACGHSLQKRKK